MVRLLFAALFSLSVGGVHADEPVSSSCPAFLDHELRKLHSRDNVNLCNMAAGKPMLVVNTASRCGYTGQFEGLEALHRKYQDRGLVVVGFASDDFRQEADTEAEAARVCYKNFGVTFTMIAPGPVTGSDANPVFQHVSGQSQPPRWNFFKYVLDRDGRVVEAFPSRVEPDDPTLVRAVESVL
ncbi:glutathione peroxidase [Marinobacter arenosus]|uniref:glutathione peroxidase n=1 Tax=Marinobacter arenosus TaxID=2856822 RepID=UPI001C4C01F0|nr:glutathione peroxidase [Marinobacter arenosus]MBW0148462.1 glutathione peroxidase [Marinobacter arenosus]